MAKKSRQTFKKRQREMAKEQKRQEKAQRVAARKTGGVPCVEEVTETKDQKPTLRIYASTRSNPLPRRE